MVGAPVGIASASFTLIFSLSTWITKKLLNITRKKKKKHDEILMLAKIKLNSFETLISQALIDMNISHEEFVTILKVNMKRWKYEKTNIKKWKNNIYFWYNIKVKNYWVFLYHWKKNFFGVI